MTISQFVNDYVFHYHFRTFAVLELDRFVGMMNVRAIKAVPADEWPQTKIGGYLADPSSYVTIDPDMYATDALRTLLKHNCAKAPVVRNGSLLGILTQADLFKLVSLKRDIAA
jgi:CBS domain-containing protein